ncbi:MAG: single-stranded-DNA-specific exonuclease RecJ [Burkholderiales bacterium]
MPDIVTRSVPQTAYDTLLKNGVSPLLARVFAARGITSAEEIEVTLKRLLPFEQLTNCQAMAKILADAIAQKKNLLIVADYDSDGATACAIGIRALRMFGADVHYLVPNRFEYGYGLTPEIVQLAAQSKPDFIITVDNGIGSVEGVAEANRLGIKVLVTDHHLPGDVLPAATCIVNPNQPDCQFPSKSIAGVGVMFYVMLALRAELRARGVYGDSNQPKLADLLDLVALGTVADVVKLDGNNRILVSEGLKRIRAGRACAGVQALLQVARRDARRAGTYDLGFMVGPRLNAAGRLDDMSLGIETLIADDMTRALQLAQQLDALNRERRDIEADMQESALAILDKLDVGDNFGFSLFDPSWHQGVIGILASRIKDKYHRPVIAFAKGMNDEIKGSGRSIYGLHLRDALDLVSKKHPDLILKFGGHAMAAGLTIREPDFETFRTEFEAALQTLLSPADLTKTIETDGELPTKETSMKLAQEIESQVWGKGFPAPVFCDVFSVESQRIVGEKHLNLKLQKDRSIFEAMLFSYADPLPAQIRATYRLSVNEYNGNQTLQLIVEHWAAE